MTRGYPRRDGKDGTREAPDIFQCSRPPDDGDQDTTHPATTDDVVK